MTSTPPSILRIFLIRFIPLALLCAGLAFLVYGIELDTRLEVLKNREEQHVRSAVRDIQRIARSITADLLYLSTTAPLQNYLNAANAEDFSEIVQDYVTFSRTNRVYDQIRLLDTDGQEIIRVDYRNNEPVVIPKAELQNKGGRYYFKDTIRLNKGQIALSPLDLNVEHNAIERPHKPMLRVGTPVFDRQNRLRGIVVLNYLASDLIQRITDNDNKEVAEHLSLLNSDGFWLRSPHPDQEWGFMLNRPDLTLANTAPKSWQRINSHIKGQFQDSQGLWSFEAVYPLAGLQQLTPTALSYHWYLISHIPHTELQYQKRHLVSTIGFLYVLTLLFVAFGVWATATARYHQKQAEFATHSQLNRIQMLMDSTVEGIYGVDLDGNCILANRSCARMLGYESPTQLLGKAMHALMHHTRPDGSFYPAEECRAHQTFLDHSLAMVDDELFWRKDGSSFPVAYHSVPIIEDGKISGMVCTFIDISERLQADKEQQRLTTVLQESLNEVYLFDTQTLRFEFVNRAALQNLGYSMDEMQAKTAYDIKPQVGETAFRAMVSSILNGSQKKLNFQTIHRRKNGSDYPVDVHLQLVHVGQESHFLAIIFDISERLALENQLRQAQKMEAIGQLASGVAHDFNNILQVISGNAQLIKLKTQTTGTGDTRHLDDILKSVERGVNLTRSMLAFARRQNLALNRQELNHLVQESELLAQKLLTKSHQLELTLHQQPLPVMADVTLLQQIIFNLVTNARDAMPDGGVIAIKTGQAELTLDFVEKHGFGCIGPHALLQVADSGHGISDEIRAKIFDPFFTTKEIGKGTGLGLAMIYGTVKQHNGYIVLDSIPGAGSTFSIYLPLADTNGLQHNSTEQLNSYAPLFGAGETLLLVEDEDDTRKYLSSFLERCHYTVLTADSGAKALEIQRTAERIDLVILDLVMPGMDGVETFEQLQLERPSLPSLFVSAHGNDLLKLRNITGHCLTKPVDMKELLTLVKQLLSSPHPISKET